MINQRYKAMLQHKDIIFEIAGYSAARAAVTGPENVFDFSLGNPSVDAPQTVADTITELVKNTAPLALHGYNPGKGIPAVRKQFADDLNRKYGAHFCADNIFVTLGAAGALAHAFRSVAEPGDEIITFAPYFSEYHPYAEGAGLTLKLVEADIESFQIQFDAFEKLLSPKTAAVLINSPNNPSGVVYSTATIQRLAEILTKKSREYGHTIYLISDEPYRDIIFSGTDAPFAANFYPNTLICYSFSKSISLPGERIGYLAVNPECDGASDIIEICPQISRTIGQNGAAGLIQRAAGLSCGLTSDLSVYETNKCLLYSALTEYGYQCVEPGGTFYMFPRSLEADDFAFCKRAMEMDLMLVPGSNFGCPGHFRIAYCVPTEKVKRSLPVFKQLAESYR